MIRWQAVRQKIALWIAPEIGAELNALRSGNTKLALENGKLLDRARHQYLPSIELLRRIPDYKTFQSLPNVVTELVEIQVGDHQAIDAGKLSNDEAIRGPIPAIVTALDEIYGEGGLAAMGISLMTRANKMEKR